MSTLESAKVEVNALHREMEQLNSVCRLDIMLVFEILDNTRTSMLHPVNVLRNFARLQARTPLIGLFDVDMLVSSALAAELVKPGMATHLAMVDPKMGALRVQKEAAAAARHRKKLRSLRAEQLQLQGSSAAAASTNGAGLLAEGHSLLSGRGGEGMAVAMSEVTKERRSLLAGKGRGGGQRQRLPAPKVALVLPAFVTSIEDPREGAEEADRAVQYSKAQVKTLFRTNVSPRGEGGEAIRGQELVITAADWVPVPVRNMTRFDPRAEGHRATNYSHWFLSTTSYLVKYTYRRPDASADAPHVRHNTPVLSNPGESQLRPALTHTVTDTFHATAPPSTAPSTGSGPRGCLPVTRGSHPRPRRRPGVGGRRGPAAPCDAGMHALPALVDRLPTHEAAGAGGSSCHGVSPPMAPHLLSLGTRGKRPDVPPPGASPHPAQAGGYACLRAERDPVGPSRTERPAIQRVTSQHTSPWHRASCGDSTSRPRRHPLLFRPVPPPGPCSNGHVNIRPHHRPPARTTALTPTTALTHQSCASPRPGRGYRLESLPGLARHQILAELGTLGQTHFGNLRLCSRDWRSAWNAEVASVSCDLRRLTDAIPFMNMLPQLGLNAKLESLTLAGVLAPGAGEGGTPFLTVESLSRAVLPWSQSLRSLRVLACHVGGCDAAALRRPGFFSGLPHLAQLQLSGVGASAALTSLSLAGCSGLQQLQCTSCSLEALDVTGCPRLTSLLCSRNKLSALHIPSAPNLTNLDCADNCLTRLDLSACPNLTQLSCSDNRLAELDVSPCQQLRDVRCCRNQLTALDVSSCGELTELRCSSSCVRTLLLSPTAMLEKLDAMDSADGLLISGCSSVPALRCDAGVLASLSPAFLSQLQHLYVYGPVTWGLAGFTELKQLVCRFGPGGSVDLTECQGLELMLPSHAGSHPVTGCDAVERLTGSLCTDDVSRFTMLTELCCSVSHYPLPGLDVSGPMGTPTQQQPATTSTQPRIQPPRARPKDSLKYRLKLDQYHFNEDLSVLDARHSMIDELADVPENVMQPPAASGQMSMASGIGLLAVSTALPPKMRRYRWCADDYELIRHLHKGYASNVYQARCKKSGDMVAVKVYRLADQEDIPRMQLFREITLHSKMLHNNIVQFYAAFMESNHVFIVQEFACGGDLHNFVYKCGGRMQERQAVSMVLQPFLKALHYLHTQGIVHS
ncbi:MAG: hypothetical protein WDW38_003038 [Sanguina aurantia]